MSTIIKPENSASPNDILQTVGSILRICIMACEGVEEQAGTDPKVTAALYNLRYTLEHTDELLTNGMIEVERVEGRLAAGGALQ